MIEWVYFNSIESFPKPETEARESSDLCQWASEITNLSTDLDGRA